MVEHAMGGIMIMEKLWSEVSDVIFIYTWWHLWNVAPSEISDVNLTQTWWNLWHVVPSEIADVIFIWTWCHPWIVTPCEISDANAARSEISDVNLTWTWCHLWHVLPSEISHEGILGLNDNAKIFEHSMLQRCGRNYIWTGKYCQCSKNAAGNISRFVSTVSPPKLRPQIYLDL